MKGDILLQNIQVKGVLPVSTGKKAKESKEFIMDSILTKLGKNLDSVRKRCSEKPLSISIVFFLKKTSYSKKDLEILSNTLIKILSKKGSKKKEDDQNLKIFTRSDLLTRIITEKQLIENDEQERFSFSIYEWQ